MNVTKLQTEKEIELRVADETIIKSTREEPIDLKKDLGDDVQRVKS